MEEIKVYVMSTYKQIPLYSCRDSFCSTQLLCSVVQPGLPFKNTKDAAIVVVAVVV